MHNAPSVTYPVGRSRWMDGLLAGLWLSGAAAVAAWCLQAGGVGWRQALGLAAVLWAGVAALWVRREAHGLAGGELRWDGQAWLWTARAGAEAAAPGSLTVHLDLQHGLLLRWQAPGAGRQWLWLSRSAHPARWDDLRRAVYSRASTDAPPDDESATATP